MTSPCHLHKSLFLCCTFLLTQVATSFHLPKPNSVFRLDKRISSSSSLNSNSCLDVYKRKIRRESLIWLQESKVGDKKTNSSSSSSSSSATPPTKKTKPSSKRRVNTNSNKRQQQSNKRNNDNNNNKNKKLQETFEERLQDIHDRHKAGEKLTQSYCDKTLGICVASNEWDSVLEVLDIMKSQNLSQQHSSYRSCLQQCLEYKNGESSLEILSAMNLAGVNVESGDVELAVLALCKQNVFGSGKRGIFWKGYSLLKQHAAAAAANVEGGKKEEEDVIAIEAYDAVFHCMVYPKKYREALQLLHDMEKGETAAAAAGDNKDGKKIMLRHPKPVLSTYHAVLEVCVASGQADQAVQLLLSMSKKGVMPTLYSFELVITSLLKSTRQWRRALKLLDTMDSLKIKPSTVIYNTIISTCAKTKDVDTAMSLFDKMRREHGIKPDIITYNSLMSACATTARWSDTLKLLDQYQREPGVTPDIITYTNAMRAFARGKKTKQALSLLDVVKDKGMELDAYFYTAAIDACAKGNMWRKALTLLDEMRQNGIEPTGFTYSVAISACGNGGQWERALELLHQMREKGMEINVITYNAAIAALAKTARKKSPKTYTARKFTKELEEDSGTNNEEHLWKHALDLLQQMEQDGVVPDAYSYSSAISACGSGGRWEEALNLVKIMQRGGPKSRPNKIAYTAAISACGRSGEWEHALQLFNDMKREGLQPDRVSYNALLYALRVSDKADEAYEIWNEMCGRSTGSDSVATARVDARWASPDMITLTDVLGTLDHSRKKYRERIDEVFNEAVKRGIVMRADSLDSLWEVDLSGMSFPVARAACHYIFDGVLDAVKEGEAVNDFTLITGIGVARRHNAGGLDRGEDEQDRSSGATALREYIRQVLRDDFNPPIYSSVPQYAAGTVVASKEIMQKWVDKQMQSK